MIAVVPSVNYSDFLAMTLPAWKRVLPPGSLRVVTSWQDAHTRRVARRYGVDVYRTDAWTKDRAKFNRARVLDEVLADASPGEVCLSFDADTYPCGRFPEESTIEPDTLYGCARYLCMTAREARLHLDGRVPREALPLMDCRLVNGTGYRIAPNLPSEVIRTAKECLGFFQCFRFSGQRFGSFPTAGEYDTIFREQFPTRYPLLGFYVLHLGESKGRNWAGRAVRRWSTAS